nr:hypothetical protein [Tanacetum cinerariifolium]
MFLKDDEFDKSRSRSGGDDLDADEVSLRLTDELLSPCVDDVATRAIPTEDTSCVDVSTLSCLKGTRYKTKLSLPVALEAYSFRSAVNEPTPSRTSLTGDSTHPIAPVSAQRKRRWEDVCPMLSPSENPLVKRKSVFTSSGRGRQGPRVTRRIGEGCKTSNNAAYK